MSTSFEQNLKRVGKNLESNLDKGLLQAALLLQRESQKLVPVDTGALKNSATIRKLSPEKLSRSLGGKLVDFAKKLFGRKTSPKYRIGYEVGYSQHYSVWVHENVNANFRVGQAKFLEQPARTLRREIGKTVELEMRAQSNQGVYSREEDL